MDAERIIGEEVIPRVAYTCWLLMSTLAEVGGGTRLAVIKWADLKQRVARSGPQIQAALAALTALGYAKTLFPIYGGGSNQTAPVVYEIDLEWWVGGAGSLVTDLRKDETVAAILEALVEARLEIGRLRDSISGLTKREFILRRDGGRCRYCGALRPGTLDHVKPSSRGGSNSAANLVACCAPCNSVKGDRTPEEAGMPLLPLPA